MFGRADKDTQHEVRANAAVERSIGTLAGHHFDDPQTKGFRLLQTAPSIVSVSNRKDMQSVSLDPLGARPVD